MKSRIDSNNEERNLEQDFEASINEVANANSECSYDEDKV